MSWEETNREDRKCPCGQGTYTIVSLSDDWNQHEERWEMNCPLCKETYILLRQSFFRSGFYEEANLWIPAVPYHEVQIREKELSAARYDVTQVAISRYLNKWLSFFAKLKTKKSIWQSLTNDGQKQPSLSAFYSYTRNIGVEDYLEQYFNYDNIPGILEQLGIIDNDLNQRFQRIKDLADELDKANFQLKRMGYR